MAAYKKWKDQTVRDSELGLSVATRDAGIQAVVDMDEQYIPQILARLAEAAEYSKKLEDSVSDCTPGPF